MRKIILVAICVCAVITGYGQEPSAAFQVDATDKGFLLPRLTSIQRDLISAPAEGLTIYNSDNKCLETYDGTNWISICGGSAVTPVVTSGACVGELIEFTFNGLTYKPVESNGKCWLDRNLGASRVATSPTDAQAYGDLYQWGRAADGHEKRNSALHNGSSVRPSTITSTGAWDGKFITIPNGTNRDDWVTTQTDTAWQGINGTNNPCPTGYRLPTAAEWTAESLSWSSINISGAFASPLKLTAAGYRRKNDGALMQVGSIGYYWSSTVFEEYEPTYAGVLLLFTFDAFVDAFGRATGYSLRCIKD